MHSPQLRHVSPRPRSISQRRAGGLEKSNSAPRDGPPVSAHRSQKPSANWTFSNCFFFLGKNLFLDIDRLSYA